MKGQIETRLGTIVIGNEVIATCAGGSLTLPFKPHNTQILYLSLLWAYFFVKFVKIMCASLR